MKRAVTIYAYSEGSGELIHLIAQPSLFAPRGGGEGTDGGHSDFPWVRML